MRNHIKEILFALSEGGVDYIVGGGVAAVLHGVERVTLDIDIAIHFAEENVDRFIAVVHTLGLQPRVPVPVNALKNPEMVRKMVEEKHALVYSLIDPADPLRYLDVFLREDMSYQVLLPDTVEVNVDGRVFRVIGAQKLLALKQAITPPRDKDVLDIQGLTRILNHDAN